MLLQPLQLDAGIKGEQEVSLNQCSEQGALQTNLPPHAGADLAVQLVAASPACGDCSCKLSLQEFRRTREEQQLLGNVK